MKKMTDYETKDYIDKLSTSSPIPGGGGTAALCGALGTALGMMVANLTIGKEKYAEFEEDLNEALNTLAEIREDLKGFIDEDAKAFEPLAEAYKMKSDTEEEKEMKRQVMEGCLYEAALVPLNVMQSCSQAIEIMEDLAIKGSKLAISDAGCGAILLKSAMQSAALNVFINTAMMKDEAKAAELDALATDLLDKYLITADHVYGMVYKQLKGEV